MKTQKPEIDIILAATIRNINTWNYFGSLCEEKGLIIEHREFDSDLKIFEYDRSTEIAIVSICSKS